MSLMNNNIHIYSKQPEENSISTEIINISKMPGGAIRDIAMGIVKLSRGLGPYLQLRVIVLDTNIILKDISYICKKRKETALLGEVESGFVRLIVTPSIIEEVYESIPEFAKNTRNDPDLMLTIWEYYKKKLTVIHPQEVTSQRLNHLATRDPDDIPTAQLIEVVGPTLALSEDKDLKDFGYAQSEEWLPYVLRTGVSIEKDALDIIIKAGGGTIFFCISSGLYMIAKNIFKVIKKFPMHFLGTLCVLAGSFIIDSRLQNWFLSKLKAITEYNAQNVPRALESIKELKSYIEDVYVKSKEAEKYLEYGKPSYDIPKTMKGYIIRALIFSPYSLTPTEILERIKAMGYRPRGLKPEAYLRRILRQDPTFCTDEKGRWVIKTD